MKRGAKTSTAILLFVLLITALASPSLLSSATGRGAGTANAQSLSSGTQGPYDAESRRIQARDLTTRFADMATRYQLGGKAERALLKQDLRDLAAQRREMLERLIESDPAELLRVALPDDRRAGLPGFVKDDVEQQVEVEGELEVMYEDWEDGSRLSYWLNVGGERLSLHFTSEPQANLLTGSQVHVKGVRIGESIALESSKEGFSAAGGDVETMSVTVPPNTFGEQKVLVLLVNFQDLQTQPFSVSQVQSTVFGTVNNFFKESSYQQTWLNGNVYGWYTLPISSSTCDTSAIATYAKQAATAAGVNLSAYNRHVFAFPSLSTCGFSGASTVGGSPSQSWINGSMTLRTVGHELEHGIGLYHARALECGSEVVGSNCTVVEYGDIIEILGQSGKTGHSHAHQKERLGWLGYGSSPGLTTVQSSGTYWLDPYETLGTNPKALKVLKSVNSTTGVSTFYYVEFRRPIGFDSFISSNNNLMNGVMVHTGVEPYGRDNYLLDMTPESSSWTDSALVVGRSYNDPNSGVTITPLSVDNSGAAVNVSFGTQQCVRVNPSMSLSPSQSQWVRAGMTASYTVTVTNNDNGGCAATSFNLQATVPSGWNAVFNSPTMSISPGSSATTTLQITSPASANDGFYNVGLAVMNSSDSTYSASCSATCVVVSSLDVNVSTDRSSYTRSQTVVVTSSVSNAGSPVSGAVVTFTLTKANGAVVTATAATAADGSAVYTYRFNKKRDPAGVYQVSAGANMNGVSGSGATSFSVQ